MHFMRYTPNSGQIIDYLYTTCSCLHSVDFIPRKDTRGALIFGPIDSGKIKDFGLFLNHGTQTSHQNLHGNLIFLDIHSLYI